MNRMTVGRCRKRVTRQVDMRYVAAVPDGYRAGGRKRWPLILFLHGAGERGSDWRLVKRHGPLRRVAEGADLPFVIVAPQCPKNGWWDPDSLLALLDHAQEAWRVDPDRCYLTGLSMGGHGVWLTAAAAPERFAAVAPICGPAAWMSRTALRRLPIWCFHGAMDLAVPISESVTMVRRLREAGCRVRFTVYPDAGHDAWTETYAGTALYDWFLQHPRRGLGSASRRRG